MRRYMLALLAASGLVLAVACGSAASNSGAGGTFGTAGAGGTGGSGGGGGGGGHGGGSNDAGIDVAPRHDGGSCASRCGASCTDTNTDPANCGFCGNRCAGYQKCVSGACATGLVCPPAVAGAPPQATAAYEVENGARAAAGIACAALVSSLDTAAADHCAYYAANASDPMCIANPHDEVAGCMDFVATDFGDRMRMAGYAGTPAAEDMAFSDDGSRATQEWIDSIWHRVPVLSPWIRDIGYGGATGCDTMDFGVGTATPATATAVYPYPGQTNVPTSFDGTYEGPPPPAPPMGWPSGYPVTVFVRGAKRALVHTITVLGSSTPIAHQILLPGDPMAMGLLSDELVLYTNAPLTAATRYHVRVEATGSSGAAKFDWVFTTM